MNKIIHGRIPAILLALLLTVTSLPLTAFADTFAETPESMPTVDEASEPVDILTENVSETEPENIQPEQNEDEAFNPETENQTEEESEPLSEDAVQAIAELYANETYKDGTYEGTGYGYKDGAVKLRIDIENGRIKNISLVSQESQSFWESKNVEQLFSAIIEQNGTDGVDVVSGATKSSKAVFDAVNDALRKAKVQEDSIFAGGDGTEAYPFLIQTVAQLEDFALSVDGGTAYEGQYIALDEDLDLSEIENWNPIGAEGATLVSSKPVEETVKLIFNGTFDGQGHTISNLKIAPSAPYTDETNVGLFSTLNNKAVVKNLNVKDAEINVTVETAGKQLRAGVITGDTFNAAKSDGTNYDPVGTQIDSCSASGSVTTQSNGALVWSGGISGRLMISSIVTNCWSDVTVTATNPSSNFSAYAGGITGTTGNYALIANCAAFGDAKAYSPADTNFGGMAGGIVGMLAGKQYNVYAAGDVEITNKTAKKHHWIGALDGEATTSAMVKQSDGSYLYPDTGAIRAYGYYAADAVLTENGSPVQSVKAVGYTEENTPSYDKLIEKSATAVDSMNTQDFADTLNGNLLAVNKLISAYGIAAAPLKTWTLIDGQVVPEGELWVNGTIDDSIFESGSGTEENPYIIRTEEQLRKFAVSMNDKIDYTGKFIKLDADIRLTQDWTPIGGSDYLFNGTFDGANHSVTNLKIGTQEAPQELDKENIYIGFFGLLGGSAVVKNLKLEVAIYTTYAVSAYVGGLVGVTQTERGDSLGAVIDNCAVTGAISHTGGKGNNFVGGIVGMQYKGAIINSYADAKLSCIVQTGDGLAEAGGLVGLNNRGLIANCYSLGDIYGNASRSNGDEGMTSIGGLIGVQAGMLVGCYATGNMTSETFSSYVGEVTGWVTGIGKAYNCFYDLDATMLNNQREVKPVESIGTVVPSGVNDEGEAYKGGLADKIVGYDAQGYAAIAEKLNDYFAAYPAELSQWGVTNNALKRWTYSDTKVTFGENYGSTTYVQPECEKVVPIEETMQDGVWYGADANKDAIVRITVKDGEVTATEVLKDRYAGKSEYLSELTREAAVDKAKEKATYGDTSNYDPADTKRFAGGQGTKESPYQIATAEQLRYLSESLNSVVDWKGIWFELTDDIDLAGTDWKPIGWAIQNELNGKATVRCAYPFRGNFDGGNHIISGMTIGSKDKPSSLYTAGLFGLTDGDYYNNDVPTESWNAVHIQNVHLRNVDIHIDTRYETFAAGLVGDAQYGIFIDNCSVTGKIDVVTAESFSRAGGISSNVLRGAVTNCWTDVDIQAVTDAGHVYAGGAFAQTNRMTIINCYALGDVKANATSTNKVHIGGFTGQAGGVQVNCYAAGNVISLKSTSDVGGVNGRNGGIAADYDCYFNSEATQKNGDVTNAENVAVGVNHEDKSLVLAEGKTAQEMKSEAFAALLNSNRTQVPQILKEHIDPFLESLQARDYVHLDYYLGNELEAWEVLDGGVVGFDTAVKKEETPGGNTGGSSGSHHSGGSSGSKLPSSTLKPETTPEPGTTSEPETTPNQDASKFTDIAGHWAEESISKAVEKGLFNGTSETTFSPEDSLTRAMAVTVLGRYTKAETSNANVVFTDVAEGSYYAPYVAWAVASGVVYGVSETEFAPETAITREQIATMIVRYLKASNATLPEMTNAIQTRGDYADISDYAVESMTICYDLGLITGRDTGMLDPHGLLTRAEFATVMLRLDDLAIQ